MKILPKKHNAPSSLGLFPYDTNVIGGVLIGMGMALTGACPGTTLVQAGTGIANGVLVSIGGVLGAMAFIKLQPLLQQARRARTRSLESQTSAVHTSSDASIEEETKGPKDIATALGIQPLVLLLIWVPMCLAVMRLAFMNDHSVRQVPSSGLVPPAYGGLLIGFAQLVTTLLAGHTIGASAAYEDIAKWIDNKVSQSASTIESKPSLLTPSVIFSSGVICSAAVLSHFMLKTGSIEASSLAATTPKIAAQAIAGGMVMVFGARTAKGCTSGHGISGLAKFSLTSLVTTAAMFSAGIVTARVAGF